ncbi:MAG: hypothetical protein GXY55_20265 [Phycisphaerae bacterium]|nr:hypothetical protein [Phycisphaerae bacterium]
MNKNRKGMKANAGDQPQAALDLTEMISTKLLRLAPLRHEELSPASTERVRRLYASVGHMLCPTFEQWEIDFVRDLIPEVEITIWEVIADAFAAYKGEHPNAGKKELITLVRISAGVELEVASADFKSLRTLYDSLCERRQEGIVSRGDGMSTVTAVGVADCHGLEFFHLKSNCLGSLYYELRAKINQRRLAVAFLAEIPTQHAAVVGRLLAVGEKSAALNTLRASADQIRLANRDGVEDSWRKIPDSSLDPWSDKLVYAGIKRSGVCPRITILQGLPGEQHVLIDGQRRTRALERLGFKESDAIGAYIVCNNDSEDRWSIFGTVVKPSASVT